MDLNLQLSIAKQEEEGGECERGVSNSWGIHPGE